MPEQDQTVNSPATENVRKRLLLAKKRAQDKAKKKVQQAIAKKVASRGLSRVIAVAFGATGVGLIVTYFIWTVQAIGGNLLGLKMITKLDLWELILWVFLSLVIFFLISLIIAFAFPIGVAFGGAWTEKWDLAKMIGSEAAKIIKDAVAAVI